jgi:hypothetical protein
MILRHLARDGVSRVRLPVWGHPEDYLHIYLTGGETFGPWGRLYSPVQLLFPDMGRPQTVLLIGSLVTDDLWQAYEGPIAPDEKPW